MVESMKTSRKLRSRPSVVNTSATRRRDQRAKRWYVLFHEPNSCGRSRQGLPVRAIHSTASTNLRLSALLRPGSPTLPGNRLLDSASPLVISKLLSHRASNPCNGLETAHALNVNRP